MECAKTSDVLLRASLHALQLQRRPSVRQLPGMIHDDIELLLKRGLGTFSDTMLATILQCEDDVSFFFHAAVHGSVHQSVTHQGASNTAGSSCHVKWM